MNAVADPTFDRRRGFLIEGSVPAPVGAFPDQVRERLRSMLAGVAYGLPPEEIAACLIDGSPPLIREALADESEREELDALVDLVLVVQEGGRG